MSIAHITPRHTQEKSRLCPNRLGGSCSLKPISVLKLARVLVLYITRRNQHQVADLPAFAREDAPPTCRPRSRSFRVPPAVRLCARAIPLRWGAPLVWQYHRVPQRPRGGPLVLESRP